MTHLHHKPYFDERIVDPSRADHNKNIYGRITGYDEELGMLSVTYHRRVEYGRGVVRVDGILYSAGTLVMAPDWFLRDEDHEHVWDDDLHYSSSNGGWGCWEVIS